MIKTAEELELKVNKARLLTRAELLEHEDYIPYVSSNYTWWLADVDEDFGGEVAYAEGNYTEDEMFCAPDTANTFVRVALDIEGENISAGDEFAYCGYVFTALSSELAISNNFLGSAKYYDEEIVEYIYSDDEITCTLDAVIASMLDC